MINGIVELPKITLFSCEPYDTVTVTASTAASLKLTMPSPKPREKGAYAFYIVRQVDANQSGNHSITAFIYQRRSEKTRSAKPGYHSSGLRCGTCRVGGRKAVKKRRKWKFRRSNVCGTKR
ncbi:YdgH/BhsA/McbA-like domain containing protein [Enterobacter hormaechei]